MHISLSSDYHRTQTLWHDQCQRDMHGKEPDDRNHCEEMQVACCVISAEQSCKFLELDRLPDRQAGKHDDDAGQDHAGIEQFLHGVVAREIVMRELERQGGSQVCNQVGGTNWKKLAAEASRHDAEGDIDDAVD